MKNYFKSYDDAFRAAEKIAKKIGGYSIGNSSILCPHGRSRCCYVYSKDREKVGVFISCTHCYEYDKM